MTGKRFTIIDEQFISYYGGTGHLISNGECKIWLWHSKEESQKVCDKLNSILDENEQLKKELDKLKLVNEMLSMDFSNSEHELWRENEQLKSLCKTLIKHIEKKSVAFIIDDEVRELLE